MAQKKPARRFGFLGELASDVGDFGRAVVDRAGGGLIRSGVRLAGLVSEPLPGEQRKGAERFIRENLEPNKNNPSGVGSYDEQSAGGRGGRIAGTAVKAGVELAFLRGGTKAGSGLVEKGAEALSAGQKTTRALGFLGGSAGGTVASTLEQVGQGKEDINVPKEFGQGLALDTVTAGGARLAKPLVSKLAEPIARKIAGGADEVKIPSVAESGERQRGLLKTTEEATSLPDEARQAITQVEPQTYKQLNIDETLNKARERVATNFDDARKFVDEGLQNNRWNDETSSVARALIEKAASQGQHEVVKDIIDKAATLGTSSGQANVLWRGMANAYDPEGMVKFAQKVVDDANKNRGTLTKIFKRGDYQLDDESKNFIRGQMGEALKLPDGEAKDQVMRNIFEKINDQVPPGASELFDAYRYQNLLSNPRTQARNTVSNLFNTMITRPATLAARASTDWFGATLFGKERQYYAKEIPSYYKGLFNSIGDAVEASKGAWKGDVPIGQPDLQSVRALRNKSVPKALTVIPRFMEAQDRFFSSLISAGEFAAQKAKGVADDVAEKEAHKVAEYSLFRSILDPNNTTGQGKLLSGIDKLSETVTKFGQNHNAFRWFVPFIRTPMNVTKQMIEYSPLGLATLPGSTRKTEQLSKALSGSMLTMIGAKLALDGNTTWEAPKDEKERQLFYESGKRPYSIKVGDKWVPMIYFGPYSLAFALPAAAKDANDNAPIDAGTTERLGAALQNSIKYFSQQTYVQGIANIVDLVSGQGDTNLSGALGFTAGQSIPLQGLQRYVAGVFDPNFRKAKGFTEAIQRDIPFASKDLEPYTNLSGEESKRNATDYLAPYTLGVPPSSSEDRAVEKANSEFLRTLRKTSRTRSRANDDINAALEAKDYGKAQQIAQNYNKRLRESFKPWVKDYRQYANQGIADQYDQQKIKLTRASIAQRRYNLIQRSESERSLVNR